jgi:hypothetical protein
MTSGISFKKITKKLFRTINLPEFCKAKYEKRNAISNTAHYAEK